MNISNFFSIRSLVYVPVVFFTGFYLIANLNEFTRLLQYRDQISNFEFKLIFIIVFAFAIAVPTIVAIYMGEKYIKNKWFNEYEGLIPKLRFLVSLYLRVSWYWFLSTALLMLISLIFDVGQTTDIGGMDEAMALYGNMFFSAVVYVLVTSILAYKNRLVV